MPAPEDRPEPALEGRNLGNTLRFLRRLLGVVHAIDGCSKRMHARFGVTAPQRLLIRIVGRFPGVSPGEVARIMEVDASTITVVLRRLEKRGWIERQEDASDRRKALLRLTPSGKRFDELRQGTVEAAVRRAMQRMTPEQLEATRGALRIVAEELNDER
jgi:DNA-binding MarR family transcriptional regulator